MSKRYIKYITKRFLKRNQLREWLRVVSTSPNTCKSTLKRSSLCVSLTMPGPLQTPSSSSTLRKRLMRSKCSNLLQKSILFELTEWDCYCTSWDMTQGGLGCSWLLAIWSYVIGQHPCESDCVFRQSQVWKIFAEFSKVKIFPQLIPGYSMPKNTTTQDFRTPQPCYKATPKKVNELSQLPSHSIFLLAHPRVCECFLIRKWRIEYWALRCCRLWCPWHWAKVFVVEAWRTALWLALGWLPKAAGNTVLAW